MSRHAPKDVVDLLANVAIFSGCTGRELTQVADLGTSTSVKAGTTITKQGGAGREFMLIVSGTARCTIDGVEVATLNSGDSFGELALLAGQPRTATVIADTDMDLLVLDPREFAQLLDSAPSISQKMLVTLAGYIRSADPDSVNL
jgi:CRP/FNR family transcriptional regulator, cyclic AMP receptor protein